MMGYGKFIFPVAVIDVAMFPELTAAGSDDFDQEVHVVTWLQIHSVACHFTNPGQELLLECLNIDLIKRAQSYSHSRRWFIRSNRIDWA